MARGELTLDRPRRRASRNGQLVPLTRKELGVLKVLMSADGAVISAEQLLERVWDEYADPFTNTVAVTVMRLRRKLGQPPLIETVTGCGYRLPCGSPASLPAAARRRPADWLPPRQRRGAPRPW